MPLIAIISSGDIIDLASSSSSVTMGPFDFALACLERNPPPDFFLLELEFLAPPLMFVPINDVENISMRSEKRFYIIVPEYISVKSTVLYSFHFTCF